MSYSLEHLEEYLFGSRFFYRHIDSEHEIPHIANHVVHHKKHVLAILEEVGVLQDVLMVDGLQKLPLIMKSLLFGQGHFALLVNF